MRPRPTALIYRSVDNGGPLGSLSSDSDFITVAGQSITRIALDVGGTVGAIRFWDNPSSESWANYFVDNPAVTLRIQTLAAGPFQLQRGAQSGNRSDWSTSDSDAQAAISGISNGDRFILALAEPVPLVAPAFVDDTGDAQNWTENVGIAPLTVPEATGNPTPTYAAVGSLPAGIAFDTTTRVLSGTPTVVGSGTITIQATNSEGTANWTVTYTTAGALKAPAFADDTGDDQNWTENVGIAPLTVPAATGNPTPTYAAVGSLPAGIAFNTTTRVLSGTPTSVGSGTITIRATNSEGTADWTVDYTTRAALVAPSFTDDTGDAQVWTQNVGITPLTVPAASGNPTPTYGVAGTLPAGIAFNTTTRVLSGAPTAVGSGTITIRATNSEGTADWTVDYTTAAPLVPPSFANDTGTPQSWTTGIAITPLTVPAANGNPTPTYAAVGTLPAGVAFNTTTRVLSGAPTAVGSGTITIRATNSEGTADWTVDYTTSSALVAPSFVDDTGDRPDLDSERSDHVVDRSRGDGQSKPYLCGGRNPPGRHSLQHHDPCVVRRADSCWQWHHHHTGHQLRGHRRLDRRLHDHGGTGRSLLRRRHG